MDRQKQRKIKIKTSDETLKGRHTNFMQVSHSKEEFVLDFFLLHPPVGQMLARFVTSPGHAKRIATAIMENIKQYEQKFEKVKEADRPETGIGFETN